MLNVSESLEPNEVLDWRTVALARKIADLVKGLASNNTLFDDKLTRTHLVIKTSLDAEHASTFLMRAPSNGISVALYLEDPRAETVSINKQLVRAERVLRISCRFERHGGGFLIFSGKPGATIFKHFSACKRSDAEDSIRSIVGSYR